MDWANTLSGLGVGLLVGLTGVGGGSLMAPIMILIFHIAPVTAVGTDLWFAGITKAFGGVVHHRQGGVDRQVLSRLLIGSLPAAIITLLVLHYSHNDPIKKGLIIYTLGGVLIVTSLATLFRHKFVAWSREFQREKGRQDHNIQGPLTILAGITLGVLVTLTSVGAGALGVTMILCLYPLRMNTNRLVATDIVHAIPLTIIGGVGYALMGKAAHAVAGHTLVGNVDLTLLWHLLLGSIPGIIVGSVLTKYIPEMGLRITLSLVLCAVGVLMIYNNLMVTK